MNSLSSGPSLRHRFEETDRRCRGPGNLPNGARLECSGESYVSKERKLTTSRGVSCKASDLRFRASVVTKKHVLMDENMSIRSTHLPCSGANESNNQSHKAW
ncbi:hypothetical protein VTN31DRAFT_107 [Thermomyces dupontii]|uniref:uncharacterized protein n=1 Tax=Talaromyces thermophilus TaxID=28565 RepID=UPI0037423409